MASFRKIDPASPAVPDLYSRFFKGTWSDTQCRKWLHSPWGFVDGDDDIMDVSIVMGVALYRWMVYFRGSHSSINGG